MSLLFVLSKIWVGGGGGGALAPSIPTYLQLCIIADPIVDQTDTEEPWTLISVVI